MIANYLRINVTSQTAERIGKYGETVPLESELLVIKEARFIPMDGGASFFAVIIYVMGEMAKAFGEGFGKSLGEKVGENLFGRQLNRDSLKNLLDFFASSVANELRQEFQKDRWDEAHDQLAVSAMALNEAFRDPARQTKDNLLDIIRTMNEGYLKLQRLGALAFPSSARMGVALIGGYALFSEISKTKASNQVALDRAEVILKELASQMEGLRQTCSLRVQGPYKKRISWRCCYAVGPNGTENLMRFVPQLIPMRRECYEAVVDGWAVAIDGSETAYMEYRDPCRDSDKLPAEEDAKAYALAHRTVVNQNFFDKFEAPYAAFVLEAEKLLEKMRKTVEGML